MRSSRIRRVQAIAATTGFIQLARPASGPRHRHVLDFSANSAGTARDTGSEFPTCRMGVVEGRRAEVLRKGNNPAAVAPSSPRQSHAVPCRGECGAMVDFTTPRPMGRTGARPRREHRDHRVHPRQGRADETRQRRRERLLTTDPRASIHGDIAHSRLCRSTSAPTTRALPRKVDVYYAPTTAPSGRAGRPQGALVVHRAGAPQQAQAAVRERTDDQLPSQPDEPPIPVAQSKTTSSTAPWASTRTR